MVASAVTIILSVSAFAQLAVRQYVDKNLRFSAFFPHPPKIETITYTNNSGDSLPARHFSASKDSEYYAITVVDASAGGYPVDLNLLEHAADEFRRRGKILIQSDDNYDPGIPGQQFSVMQQDGRQLRASVYMQYYRLYITEAVGPPGSLSVFQFEQSAALLDADGKEINLSP